MVKEIRDATPDGGEGLLALVVRCVQSISPPYCRFLTDRHQPMQVGVMSHPPCHVVPPHRHHPLPRSISFTQEVLVIRRGWCNVDVYTSAGSLVERVRVESGDVVVLLSGGHGVTVGADGCEILECKTGPYLGKELDKSDLSVSLKDQRPC